MHSRTAILFMPHEQDTWPSPGREAPGARRARSEQVSARPGPKEAGGNRRGAPDTAQGTQAGPRHPGEPKHTEDAECVLLGFLDLAARMSRQGVIRAKGVGGGGCKVWWALQNVTQTQETVHHLRHPLVATRGGGGGWFGFCSLLCENTHNLKLTS